MENRFLQLVNTLKKCSLMDIAFLINAISVVNIKLVPYGISVMFLIWLFEILRRKIVLDINLFKGSIFIAIPFFLACFSLVYTSNLNKGIDELSLLLPFLLYPFFYLFKKIKYIPFYTRSTFYNFYFIDRIRL